MLAAGLDTLVGDVICLLSAGGLGAEQIPLLVVRDQVKLGRGGDEKMRTKPRGRMPDATKEKKMK